MPTKIGIGLSICKGGTSRGDDTLLPSYEWEPRDVVGAVFWLPTANLASLWQQNNGASASTHPAAGSTDPVGVINEAIGAFRVTSGSDGARPLIGNDATQLSYLTYGTSKVSIVSESSKFFRYFTAQKRGGILLKVKFDADAGGANNNILDAINMSGAGIGFNLRRNTDNTISFQIGNGAGSETATSSTTVNATGDTAWHYIRAWCDGTKANLRIDGGATFQSTNLTTTNNDMSNDLQIGLRTSGSLPMLGSIADLVITNGTSISDADYALWLAYNPAQNLSNPSRITAAGNSLTPDQVSHLHSWYDFSVVSTMWTTSAKAVQVAANADKIGFIENKMTLPTNAGSYQRHLLQSTDAKRPAYATNVSNSLGACLYAGSSTLPTSDYTGEQDLVPFATWNRGAKTWFVVYKNTRATDGSHLCSANGVYTAIGGSAHGTTNRRNLIVQHPPSGTDLVTATNPNGGEGFGIYALRADGLTAKAWLCNRFDLSEVGSATDFGDYLPSHWGRPTILAWDMAGYICEIVCYGVALPDSTIRKLVNGLATKWGISNIPTTLDNVP